jgi:hypothetical protein
MQLWGQKNLDADRAGCLPPSLKLLAERRRGMANATYKGTVPMARTIQDMKVGEIGYTVPWAYHPKTEELDEEYPIDSEPGGTAVLTVHCIAPRIYQVYLMPNSYFLYHK